MRQHEAAVPVDVGHQIGESTCQAQVRDVGAPNLIRPRYHYLPKQIGIVTVSFCRGTEPWPWVNGLQPHSPHQPLDPFSVDHIPHPLQPKTHLSAAEERVCGIFLVYQVHQLHVFRVLPDRGFVARGAIEAKELALSHDADRRLQAVYTLTQPTR